MRWLRQYMEAAPQTKWFIFNWVFYAILTFGTLIYCYARLDFVRTGPQTPQVMEQVNK